MMQPMVMQFPPFHIDEADYKTGNIVVKATSPSGKTLPLQISQDKGGQFTTNFLPNEIGDWCICISSNNRPIKGSPFTVRVYDASKVRVFGLEGGEDGRAVSFNVDASKAGNGKLSIEVMKDDGNEIMCNISKSGQNQKVTFEPRGPGVYTVKVVYATIEVPGSPFQVTIVDTKSIVASGEGLRSGLVGRVASFRVDTGKAGNSNVEVTVNITSSNGVAVSSYAKPIGGGAYEINYIPDDIGQYTIKVDYGGKAIPGSPFMADVFSLSHVKVISLTKEVVIYKTAVLEFDARDTGLGEPEVKVDNGKQDFDMRKFDNRKYRVSFTPDRPGAYYIEVEMYGEAIPESPFVVDVHDGTDVSTTLDCSKGMVKTPLRFDIDTLPYKGEIKVQVYSPTRKNVQCKLFKVNECFYNAEFLPLELGNYDVQIFFEGNQIRGSPFLVPVANPQGVLLSMKSRSIILGQTFHMTADTTKAGPGDLAVRASGTSGSLPIEGNLMTTGMYNIAFNPEAVGQYFVEVDFDCKPLPESPITLMVYDIKNIEVTGIDCSLIRVGNSKSFHVNTLNAGPAELQAKLTAPGNSSLPLKITGNSKSGFDITLIPKDAGPHYVELTYGGVPVPSSPITLMAFDTSKIKVIGINDGLVGRPSNFLIDLNNSGEGELEVVVTSSNGKPVVNEVNALNPGKLDVCFVPLEGGKHYVEVSFNKEAVPGSPFLMKVLDASNIQVMGDGVDRVPINETALFYITGQDIKANDIEVTIRGPQNSRHIVANVSGSGSNKLKVEYIPKNVGEYEIAINYLGAPVLGSPFQAKVWDASKVHVSRLSQAFVGIESTFTIEMRDVGDGTVEISILDPTGQLIPNNVTSTNPGVIQVAYVPMVSGLHNVMVEFNGVRVNGTPRQVNVVDPSKVSVRGEGIGSVQCNTYTNFTITAPDATLRDIDAKITDPLGKEVSCNVVERGGNFRVDYTPTIVGNYLIDVCCFNSPVKGTPFVSNVWDHKKVKITDQNITPQAGCRSTFKVLVAEAGDGMCEVSITDCNGNLVPNQICNPDPGVVEVGFSAMKHGVYRATVLFNEKYVPGSPFSFNVIDSDKVTCKVPTNGYVPVKKVTLVTVYAPMAKRNDLNFQVIGPNENEVSTNVTETGESTYKVDFTPDIAGDYRLAVRYFECPIALSTLKAWDLSKVYVGCIKVGRVGCENEFEVDVRDAGEGSFEVSIENNKGQLNENSVVADPKVKGLYHVTTIPSVVGAHKVNVLFNSQHVKGSPFTMPVCDPTQVCVEGEGLHIVRCNRPTGFHISGPEALTNDVHCIIQSPSGSDVKCKVKDESCGKFTAEYTPKETGEHLVYVKYFDEPVKDSPFMVLCWDPAKVVVDCIRPSIVGRPNAFFVNVSEAGPGSLEVTVTSRGQVVKNTAKTSPELGVVEVLFTPVNVDPHMIIVKFNEEPIPGSPFSALVLDGAQAWAKGPGLGVVRVGEATRFTVVANAVGCDAEFEVLITSPSGVSIPCSISGSYASGYTVEYVPVDAGEHCIRVVYADSEIKDSPFYPCAFDPERVVLMDRMPFACLRKPVSFRVDASGAGPGKISVSVVGVKSRPYVDVVTTNNIHIATFTPVEGVVHDVSVRFNDTEIIDSPFKCTVLDEKKLRVSWESQGLKPVGEPVSLTIDTNNDVEMPLTANVVDPFGRNIESMKDTQRGVYTLEFVPMSVGTYVIHLSYGCDVVPGSPFKCDTYDVSMVKVLDLTSCGCVGDDVFFSVDTSEAGPGVVDVDVKCMEKSVTVGKEKFTNKCRYSFKTDCPWMYTVHVSFNKSIVRGSPFEYCVVNPAKSLHLSSGNNNCPVAVGHLAWAVLEPPMGVQIHSEDCEVVVMGPFDDKPIPSRKSILSNGNVKIEYTSAFIGLHAIKVRYGEEEVPGSPCVNPIFDPNGVIIEGCQSGEVGKKVFLDISTSNAGEADLVLHVMDSSNKEHPFTLDQEEQDYHVTYVPFESGVYKVMVTYGGFNVPGCPVRQEIKAFHPANASGEGLVKGMVGKLATFNVDTLNQKGELVVTVRGPSGQIDSMVSPLPDGNFRVEYEPQEVGRHEVDVYFNCKLVQSTFHPKISDPMGVSIMDNDACWSQEDYLYVRPHQLKSILFDTSNAGPGKMTVMIESPDSTTLNSDVITHLNQVNVKFIPKSIGSYVIRVFYNDLPTKVFPIIAICEPEEIDIFLPPRMEECHLQKADCGCEEPEEQACNCASEAACGCYGGKGGLQKMRMDKMYGRNSPYPSPPPSNYEESEVSYDDQKAKVRFGKCNEEPSYGYPKVMPPIFVSEEEFTQQSNYPPPYLPTHSSNYPVYDYNSPYQVPTSEDIPCQECSSCNDCGGFVGAPLVDPSMPPQFQPIFVEQQPQYPYEVNASHLSHNIDRLPMCHCHCEEPPEPKTISVQTEPEQRPGFTQTDAVEPPPPCPELIPCPQCPDFPDFSCPHPQPIFIQEAPEPAHIYVDYCHEHMPIMPHEPIIDENLVVVSGAGLSLVRCREQGCFVIDGTMAGPGVPSAKMTGLKEELPVMIELIDEQMYGCSYVACHPGAYLLTILWCDRQIPSSPIKVTVLASCDASQANFRADCLMGAQVNNETSVVVDCRRAGIGSLKACIQGPSKLHNCEVDDRKDGTYEVLFKPLEIGNYCMNLTYDDTHIIGSPYNFKVNACADASKVNVGGEGLRNGILATFDSSFAVDTQGAGQGQLNVKVRGKKGTFQVQMRKDPHKDRVVLCRFNPTEIGEYLLNVLWSGDHVPGSPFKVVIVDTIDEMKGLRAMGGGGQMGNCYGSLSGDPGKDFSFQEDY